MEMEKEGWYMSSLKPFPSFPAKDTPALALPCRSYCIGQLLDSEYGYSFTSNAFAELQLACEVSRSPSGYDIKLP